MIVIVFKPNQRRSMVYLWSSHEFLKSFPTVRGGGGVKFFEVSGEVYGATHVSNTFEQRPAFSDVEFIVFGDAKYIVSLNFPGVVYSGRGQLTCQDYYGIMYDEWYDKLNPPVVCAGDVLQENISFSQDDVLNFFRRLGCLV